MTENSHTLKTGLLGTAGLSLLALLKDFYSYLKQAWKRFQSPVLDRPKQGLPSVPILCRVCLVFLPCILSAIHMHIDVNDFIWLFFLENFGIADFGMSCTWGHDIDKAEKRREKLWRVDWGKPNSTLLWTRPKETHRHRHRQTNRQTDKHQTHIQRGREKQANTFIHFFMSSYAFVCPSLYSVYLSNLFHTL